MEKVLPSIHNRYCDIQLFEQDVRDLIAAMSHDGRKVEIQIDDWKLDGLDELEQLAKQQQVAARLLLLSYPVEKDKHYWMYDVYLSVSEGRASVRVDSATVGLRGLIALLDAVFSRCVVPVEEGETRAWEKRKWDTIILQPRPIQIRIATAISPMPVVTSPTPKQDEPMKRLDMDSIGPPPAVQQIFHGPSTHNIGTATQNVAGHDQNIATDHGRISVNKPERGTNWFTKEVVKKIIGIVGAIIVAGILIYLKGKMGGKPTP